MNSYSFPKRTVRDIPVEKKRILLRADYNVPLDDSGEISSDFRIEQSLPTLRYLLERGASIVIISHLGRPDSDQGKRYSLKKVADRLSELMPEYPVQFQPSTTDDAAYQACHRLRDGQVLMLENLRYNPGEEADSVELARNIYHVSGADYFVQDGFGVAHRSHTSTDTITHLLPSVAGLLLEREFKTLKSVMSSPSHPVVAIIGGAKISDKIKFIERLLVIADTILIGGAMANTFLYHDGYPVGKSLLEKDQGKIIDKIMERAREGQIILPTDVVTSTEISKEAPATLRSISQVEESEIILDIGQETIKQFKECLKSAKTVIWNGTLGYAEYSQFASGSEAVADAMSRLLTAETVIGGGDTADFAIEWQGGNSEAFTHISTGGGAGLELMSGMRLPGVEALIS